MDIRTCNLSRTANVSSKPEADSRVFEVAFSSETPVERFGELEILSHEPGAAQLLRLNNGAPLLFNHDRNRYVGVVVPGTARIDPDRVGRAQVRIKEGEDGDEILRDVRSGILSKISFLYRIHAWKDEPARPDGKKAYRVTDWEPLEISLVTIPADDSVGVGRSLSLNQKSESYMENPKGKEEQSVPAPAPAAPESNPEARDEVVENDAAARFFRLADIARSVPDARSRAEKALLRGASEADFRRELLAEMESRDAGKPKESVPARGFAGDFLSARDLSKYSVMKAVRAAANPGDRAAQEAARFEIEVSEECAKAQASRGGLIIPGAALARSILSVKGGDGYAGTGGNLVPVELLADQFVELLKNRLSVGKYATVLTGLKGDIAIPTQLTGASAAWGEEDSDAPEQSVTFGQIQLSPKQISSYLPISHKLLMQSSISVDAFVSRTLVDQIALGIDAAILYGDGKGESPTGIANTAGIYKKTLTGTPTFADLVDLESEISALNADVSVMRYAFGARLRGALKTTKKFATSGSDATIWEANDTVNGYAADVSNQIKNGDVFFGAFDQIITAIWGGTELIVDREWRNRRTNIAVFNDIDIAVRRPEAFAYATATPTAEDEPEAAKS